MFQFYSFPKAWLPFGILNLLIEFSLKESEFLRLPSSSIRRKRKKRKKKLVYRIATRINTGQPELCQSTNFHLSHEYLPCLNTIVTCLRMVNFWRVLGARGTNKRGRGFNFMSNLNILFQINMYIAKCFYR